MMRYAQSRFAAVPLVWAAAALSASCASAQSGGTAQPPAKSPLASGAAGPPVPSAPAEAAEIVIFGFEEGLEGWAVPDWAKASADNVGLSCEVSEAQASQGTASMEIQADFPGGRWTGAYVERETEVTDWTEFGALSVDVFLPATAPEGLGGRIILTVGDRWEWTEMNRTVPLKPGAWTTIAVSVKRFSMDWKFFPDDEFRRSIRKIGVRIESNREPAYRGPVYLDNIRLAEHL
jgi:hypothetical protein